MLKEPKIRSKKHLRFIASLPCLICWIEGMTQAAHIRSGNGAGTSLKSGDDCTVPLCVSCHRKQHGKSEAVFWSPYGGLENATSLAKALFKATTDEAEAIFLMRVFNDF